MKKSILEQLKNFGLNPQHWNLYRSDLVLKQKEKNQDKAKQSDKTQLKKTPYEKGWWNHKKSEKSWGERDSHIIKFTNNRDRGLSLTARVKVLQKKNHRRALIQQLSLDPIF